MNRPIKTEIMGCTIHHITEDPDVAYLWEELMLRESNVKGQVKREERSDERYKRICRDRKLMIPIIERNTTLNNLLEERSINASVTFIHCCGYEATRHGKLYWRTREGWNGMTVLEAVVVLEEDRKCLADRAEYVVEKYEGDIPMDKRQLESFADSLYDGEFEPTLLIGSRCDRIIYTKYDKATAKMIEDAKNDRWVERWAFAKNKK